MTDTKSKPPEQVKMLEVEEPVSPIKTLPTDTSWKPTPVKPLDPISPKMIDPTPQGSDGESNAQHSSALKAIMARVKGSS